MSVIDKIKLDGTTYDVGKTPDTTLAVSGSPADAATVGTELDKKVDKVTGKGLSTEDFTTAEKTKLAGIAEGATNIIIDPTLSQSGKAADAKETGDKLNELESDLTTKANADGSYDTLTAGNAKQLLSNLEQTDMVPYNYRIAGGSLEIGDREKLKKIVGGSLAVNQLADVTDGKYVSTNAEPTLGRIKLYFRLQGQATPYIYYESIGSAKVVQTIVESTFTGLGEILHNGVRIQQKYAQNMNIVEGHKYLINLNFTSVDINTVGGVVVEDIMCIDLTQMFGTTIADYIYSLETATAGAGVARLKAHFPRIFNAGYIPYNAGTLEHVSGLSAHKMVGFNAYDHTTGKAKVLGGNIYQITGTYTALSLDGTPITPDASGYFTPDRNGELTVTGGNVTDTCVHLKGDGERDGEYEPYEEHSYPLDSDVTLRGIYKLDANNQLYTDGDEYEADGTVTRNTILRAYQSGDESLANAITDGTNTVVYSANVSTETADPYTEIQNVSNWGTEEFVTESLVPVGHETAYQPDLRAKIEVAPESPDTDGVYIMQRENGLNSYAALASSATIQDIISRLDGLSPEKGKMVAVGITAEFIGDECDGLADQSINTSGIASVSANYKATDFIKVSKGDIVYYSLYSSSTVNAISFYTSNTEDSYVANSGVTNARVGTKLSVYVVSANGYIRACYNKNNVANPVIIIATGVLAQLEKGIEDLDNRLDDVEIPLESGKYGAWKFKTQENTVVEKILADKDNKTITIGLIADTHNTNAESRRSAKQAIAINAICEKVGADFIVHLGDVIEGSLSTKALNEQYLAEFWSAQNQTFLPVLYTVAHHEQYGPLGAGSWGNDPNAITEPECVGMVGKTARQLQVTYSSDKGSWYFDLDGIRFIGLDSASIKSGTGSNPASFSVDVLDFLTSALTNCNLPVVIFSHAPASNKVSFRATYTINGDDATIRSSGQGRQSVVTQLNAYTPGILAYIHGHCHWDNIAKPTDCDFTYISIINAHAAKADTVTNGTERGVIGTPTSYDRVVGEYSEYGFDIVNLHTDTGAFNLFRFGAGSDRTFPVT